MDFITQIIDLLKLAIVAIGLGTAIVGGITFGQAYQSEDATKKSTGVNTIIGGAIIAAIGFVLVPRLADYIPTAAVIMPFWM